MIYIDQHSIHVNLILTYRWSIDCTINIDVADVDTVAHMATNIHFQRYYVCSMCSYRVNPVHWYSTDHS